MWFALTSCPSKHWGYILTWTQAREEKRARQGQKQPSSAVPPSDGGGKGKEAKGGKGKKRSKAASKGESSDLAFASPRPKLSTGPGENRGPAAVSFSPRPDLPQGGLGSFSVAVGRSTPVISATETSPLVPVGRSTPVISGSQGTPEEISQVSAGRSTPAIAEARESTSQILSDPVGRRPPATSGPFDSASLATQDLVGRSPPAVANSLHKTYTHLISSNMHS